MKRCMWNNCSEIAIARGLCRPHYFKRYDEVSRGLETWETLARDGKALPSSFERSGHPRRKKLALLDFWNGLSKWSQKTFGADNVRGPEGPLKHLAKEVQETLKAQKDLEEYADLLFLVFDATRRAGFSYSDLVEAVFAKLEKNKARKWGPASPTEAVEHIREEEE